MKLNFLFAVLFFSQLHGLGRKHYLHTACFCTVNQFFISRLMYSSYLVLVSFMVGRCYKSESDLILSLGGEQAVTFFPAPAVSCWWGVQTVLSMTHGLV